MIRPGIAVLALAGTALAAAPASAHVTVLPAQSRPADLQRYRVIVPNERDVPTTGVDVQLPQGIDFVLVEEQPGWTSTLKRSGSSVRQVSWKGEIPKDGYAELHLIVRNPVATGAQPFKALQRYADGDVVRWIGAEGTDEPAPVVTLSEDATPVDVVSTHGDAPTPAAAPASGAVSAVGVGFPEKDDTDVLPIVGVVLGGLGLLAGLAALAVSKRRYPT